MIPERRTYQRAKKQLTLKIADDTFDIITETVDISLTGTYCRVARLLPLMSKIEIVILVPDKSGSNETKKIKCQGVVVRTEPVILKDAEKAHYNVAIFFTDISSKDQKVIESYLDSGSPEDAKAEVNAD
jgi:c-di-GMP-binding flagellar brake protein YcgR